MMFPIFQKYSLYKETECIVSYNTLTTNNFDNQKTYNMSNKQTAVDWLYEHLFPKQIDGFSEDEWNKIDTAFAKAKEMEKEQIMEAYDSGLFDGTMDIVKDRMYKKYYNKTYGKSNT